MTTLELTADDVDQLRFILGSYLSDLRMEIADTDRGLRLPERGGYLSLPPMGSGLTLHLWEGDAQGFDQDAQDALLIAASILGVALARRAGR